MTHEEVDKIVEEWADDIAADIETGNIAREQAGDLVSEVVDLGWHELGFFMGRIDDWPINPGAEVLGLCGTVLDYCEEKAWIENDSGLWEGLNGAAVLGCQAYHSLQNVLWQKLRDRKIID